MIAGGAVGCKRRLASLLLTRVYGTSQIPDHFCAAGVLGPFERRSIVVDITDVETSASFDK
jgi:hypothetical protein